MQGGYPPGNNPYGSAPGGSPPGSPAGPPPGGGGFTPPPMAGYPGLAPLAIPGAPHGVHPTLGIPYSEKSKLAAGLLQLLGGGLFGLPGIGRFYTGHTALGVAQLVGALAAWAATIISCGLLFFLPIGFWLWGIIDGVLILASESKDTEGRLLR